MKRNAVELLLKKKKKSRDSEKIRTKGSFDKPAGTKRTTANSITADGTTTKPVRANL